MGRVSMRVDEPTMAPAMPPMVCRQQQQVQQQPAGATPGGPTAPCSGGCRVTVMGGGVLALMALFLLLLGEAGLDREEDLRQPVEVEVAEDEGRRAADLGLQGQDEQR